MKIASFALSSAWYSPMWKGEKKNVFARMYTRSIAARWRRPRALADHHASLLKRIVAWQEVLYSEQVCRIICAIHSSISFI